jgi:hypothetical protein
VSHTGHTQRSKPEQRKAVQVSLRPSIYQIALDLANDNDTFPGRIIERALLNLDGGKLILQESSQYDQ